jgi:hypothetical protein
MSTLLFKLIGCPLLIGVVSLAGRRWGPAVGGWLIGLPLTSGPVVLFLALDQGTGFASTAAQAIMLGIISVGMFCLTYSWLARSWGWLPTVLAGWLAVLASTFLLDQVSLAALPAFVIVLAVLGSVLRLMPTEGGQHRPAGTPSWDIPVRMVVATAFVVGLTALAQVLGPRLSGLLAPFPMFATILSVFTHRFQGGVVAGHLLRGVVLGSFSFATFFLVVAALLPHVGIVLTFACATLVALGTHGLSLLLLRRNRATDTDVPEAFPPIS